MALAAVEASGEPVTACERGANGHSTTSPWTSKASTAAPMMAPATSPAAIHRNLVRAGGATDGDVRAVSWRDRGRRQRAGERRGGLEPLDSRQQRHRFVPRRAMLDGGRHQLAGRAGVSAIQGRDPRVEQLVPLALPFGDRAARPLDVGARPRMAAVDEQHARPDIDRQFVLFGKVVVEPEDEQFLDAGIPIAVRRCGVSVGTNRFCHLVVRGKACGEL